MMEAAELSRVVFVVVRIIGYVVMVSVICTFPGCHQTRQWMQQKKVDVVAKDAI